MREGFYAYEQSRKAKPRRKSERESSMASGSK
jgi:hypothetical protein